MAKRGPTYHCQSCGAVYHRWQGKCDACGTWSSLVEDAQAAPVPGGGRPSSGGRARGRVFVLETLKGETQDAPRIVSGIGELDRVTGGGFVPGSVLLIGGDPGIGKSTLLMQACAALAMGGRRVVYVSGEESTGQVRLRAERMGLAEAPVDLAAETNVEDIVATLNQGERPALVVIDSIQTMWSGEVESAPGTVTQVRGSAQALIRYAKTSGVCLILVGHVTKDGQIAGPRVVEHMVDAVLSFEGEGAHSFRILRGQKNRFGATDEALFLAGRDQPAPGAAVFAGMEGTRPVLVEIQALVAPTALGTPRRAVVGWENSRLAMVLAVLETHGGLRLGQHDVYLNVAGGLRVNEPAADVAVAAALVSSLSGATLPQEAVYFGEIALSGAIRPVAVAAARLREAAKLGFEAALMPSGGADHGDGNGLNLRRFGHVTELVADIAARAPRRDVK